MIKTKGSRAMRARSMLCGIQQESCQALPWVDFRPIQR
jgi:hypothetical protein